MARTSGKQKEIYDFLQKFTVEHGYAPSVREICAAVGLKSTASVHYHLNELKRQGRIDMSDNKNRTISVTCQRESSGKIPILRVVAGKLPALDRENIEGYLPCTGSDDCFALRVREDSMTGAGIFDGDIAVIHPQDAASDGEIVLALLENGAAIRRFSCSGNGVWLISENDAFSPVDGRRANILGKVVSLVRNYQ